MTLEEYKQYKQDVLNGTISTESANYTELKTQYDEEQAKNIQANIKIKQLIYISIFLTIALTSVILAIIIKITLNKIKANVRKELIEEMKNKY